MEQFDFLFGLHLRERLYSHTYNLPKDLQGTKVAAVSGRQCLANLTKETLKKMRTSQSFDHLFIYLFLASLSNYCNCVANK